MIEKKYARLVRAAKDARKNAMCGYSHYAVGAAVLASSGRIYPGCNIESPTLINHICAERVAIGNAISHGDRILKAVCTVSADSEPCGACRQYILEFAANPEMPIISLHVGGGAERVIRTTIGRLLPNAHTREQIQANQRGNGNEHEKDERNP